MSKKVEFSKYVKKISVTNLEALKDIRKYLVLPFWYEKHIGEAVISAAPSKQFNETIEKFVNAFLFENKEPPAAIAGVIMNIADDVLNSREITLRAGDYITLQNYVKTM